MSTIYLEPNQVPAQLRGKYTGTKFQVEVCETMTIPMDAGLWSGGSRDSYYGIDLATGESAALPWGQSAPWSGERKEATVTLQPGKVVVCHSMFCGKDMGLRFFLHPSNAAALLPAPSAELTSHEKIVLSATRSYKSSYGGKDRYQMAQDETRYSDRAASFPSRDQWDAAKASLITKGLLNKAGAITVAGRNASR